jgi:hypothetical protein
LKLNVADVLLETVIDWDGDFPEFEGTCGDVIKFRLLLLLDGFLEGADGLCSGNFDREYVAGVIALDETIEYENRD